VGAVGVLLHRAAARPRATGPGVPYRCSRPDPPPGGARRCEADPRRADCGGHLAASHRLRERGQPAAAARLAPGTRDRDPPRAGVMLAGAGLLVRSLQHLERLDLGYDADHLSIVELAVPFAKYDSDQKIFAMFDDLYGRLRAVPGVTALTPLLYAPFLGANLMQVTPVLDGQSEAAVDVNPPVPLEGGGIEYFRTFGIPILRGRGFL